eukprot:228077-Chlamydomonas_euryale.AAC.6
MAGAQGWREVHRRSRGCPAGVRRVMGVLTSSHEKPRLAWMEAMGRKDKRQACLGRGDGEGLVSVHEVFCRPEFGVAGGAGAEPLNAPNPKP